MRAARWRGEDASKAVNRFLDEYADDAEAEQAATKDAAAGSRRRQ